MKLGYLGYGKSRISRILWNQYICVMVELGYVGCAGTRISMIWWNEDIWDMVELDI